MTCDKYCHRASGGELQVERNATWMSARKAPPCRADAYGRGMRARRPLALVLLAPLVLVGIAGCGGEATAPEVRPAPEVRTPITGNPTEVVPQQLLDRVVGMEEAKSITAIESAGFAPRVVERDGERFAATMDYRPDRVNLVITDGRVASASRG